MHIIINHLIKNPIGKIFESDLIYILYATELRVTLHINRFTKRSKEGILKVILRISPIKLF